MAQAEAGAKTQETRKKTVTIGGTGAKSLQDGTEGLPGNSDSPRTEGSVREPSEKTGTVVAKTDIKTADAGVILPPVVEGVPQPSEAVPMQCEVVPSTPLSEAVIDGLSANSGQSFSSSAFFPSPCKDSNSSSDILAKAMKVAHVTNSDAELSADQSLMGGNMPVKHSTSGACEPGEVTAESVSRTGFSSNPISDSSQGTKEPVWTK